MYHGAEGANVGSGVVGVTVGSGDVEGAGETVGGEVGDTVGKGVESGTRQICHPAWVTEPSEYQLMLELVETETPSGEELPEYCTPSTVK